MLQFDQLVMNWARNAHIPSDQKIGLLKKCVDGTNSYDEVFKKGVSVETKDEINTFIEELESPKAETKKNDPEMKLPPVGMGSYVGDLQGHTSPDHGRNMAHEGIRAGFRLIDCAMYYQNEQVIGLGIKDAIDEGIVQREDLFICTKVAHPNVERTNYKDSPYVSDPTLDAKSGVYDDVKKSYDNLAIGPIDLVLLHWPGDFDGTDPDLAKSKRIAMWRGLEEAKEDGLVKSIGVSNFTLQHYDQLLEYELKHLPAANQIEVNPYIPNVDLVLGSQKRGMDIMAYCPLGSAAALSEDILITMADTLSSTPANIILSWLASRSIVPIPQSTKPERLASNLAAVMEPVELSRENIDKIAQLADPDKRICPDPASIL